MKEIGWRLKWIAKVKSIEMETDNEVYVCPDGCYPAVDSIPVSMMLCFYSSSLLTFFVCHRVMIILLLKLL